MSFISKLKNICITKKLSPKRKNALSKRTAEIPSEVLRNVTFFSNYFVMKNEIINRAYNKLPIYWMWLTSKVDHLPANSLTLCLVSMDQ